MQPNPSDFYFSIAVDYISVCFELEKHEPGLVDAYFGPPELRSLIEETGKKPVAEILSQIDDILLQLEENIFDEDRSAFLSKQFTALQTIANRLNGKSYTFLEETELLYDIKPQMVPESHYQEALDAIDRLLPGSGSIAERLEGFQKQLIIPEDKVLEMFTLASEEARKRTKEFLPLPEEEKFEIQLVTGKPWSGYNWFKGKSTSLIELNVDLPRRADQLIPLMTHEGYPGHHTELSMRERLLYHEKNYLEYSIYPLYSPMSVISEGYADLGEEILFTDQEAASFMRDTILPELEIELFNIDTWLKIKTALADLKSVAGNAAILLLEENRSEDEVFEYIRKYALLDEESARKRIDFIKTYRGYIFNYHYGYELLKHYFENKNLRSEILGFLSEPAYPSKFSK